MNTQEAKKDHSIGAGTGAIGGAMTGAVVGSVAGPIGTVVGGLVGGVVGAKAGDALAEAINPTEYEAVFERDYTSKPYYDSALGWKDYRPAYQYGYSTYPAYRGQTFEQAEAALARGWEDARQESSLAWSQAREAVRDGWHHIERAMPGDFDRDGR